MIRKAVVTAAFVTVSCARIVLAQDVSLSLMEAGDGAYQLRGSFFVEAPPETVWAVLTDYDSIPKFVSTMESSRVKERHGNDLLLEQKASVDFLFFSRKVELLLNIRERPFEEISFEDVSRRDFVFYAGSWHLEPAEGGMWVLYNLKAKQDSAWPNFIVRKLFKSNAKRLLEEIGSEILRRKENNATRL